MSNSEYIEYIIRLKMIEAKRGLTEFSNDLATFDKTTKQSLLRVGSHFEFLDRRAAILKASLTSTLQGLQKELKAVAATSDKAFAAMAPDVNGSNLNAYLNQLGQIALLSKSAANGLAKLQEQQKAVAEAPKKDFDEATQALIREAEAARLLAAQVKSANDQISNSTKASSNTVKAELDKEKKAAEDTGKAGKKMGDDWKDGLQAMQGALGAVAAVAGTAFATLSAAGGMSEKAFGDLESNANTLRAVSGATVEELDRMTEKSLELAPKVGKFATAIESADTELARLGFTSSEVIDSIDAIATAATASGETIEESGTLIAGTIRGFGLEAKDAGRVSDILAKSANVSALSFGSLGLSMKYIAPVARASNQGLTEMTAILAELSNNMILGEQAGTSVRAMLTALVNPSTDAKKLFDDLKFTAQDAHGKLKPLAQIFEELRGKLKGFNEVGQGKILAEIFGTEALSAAQVLMKASKADLDKLTKSIDDSGGSSEAAANIMSKGLNAELTKLSVKSNTLAITIGKELSPAVEDVVKFLGKMLDTVQALPEPTRQSAIQVGFLAAAVTGLGLAFSGALLGGGKLILLVKELAEKLPFLAPLLSGGALMGATGLGAIAIGGGIAAALQIGAMDIDTQTKDKEIEHSDPNKSISRINALLFKADQGKDFSKLSKDELRQAQVDAQAVQTYYSNQIQNIKATSAALEKARADLRKYEDIDHPGSINGILRDRVTELKGQVEAQATTLTRLQENLKRYLELEEKFQATTSKVPDKPKSSKSGGADAPDHDADKAAGQKQLKDTTEFFDKMTQRRQGLRDKWLQTAQDMQSADAKTTEFGQKLADAAAHVTDGITKSGKACLAGVNTAFIEATGKELKFITNAYETLSTLRADARFQEIQWDRKSILPAGTVVAWEKGSSKSGHISIADGKGNEMSDFKGRQMSSHYGGGAPHAFVPKGSGVGGKDIKDNIAAQQVLNQLMQQYTVDLAQAEAYAKKLPEGSEARKKAEEEIKKIEHAAAEDKLNLTKMKEDFERKYREQMIKWANEQLDIDASIAEASAKLTVDSRDDIEAAYKRSLAEIAKSETTRLAEEGTTEEQRLALKKMYDTQRLAAEKSYQDQVKAYNKERVDYLRNLDFSLEDSRIQLMADGLDKTLAGIELEKQRRLAAIEEEIDAERKRWESSAEGLAWMAEHAQSGRQDTLDHSGLGLAHNEGLRFDASPEGQKKNLQRFGVDAWADDQSAQAIRLDKNRRALEALSERNADADARLRGSLIGEKDPAVIEKLQSDALRERLQTQHDISAELERQKQEAKGGPNSNEALEFTKKIADSKRQEIGLEQQLSEMVFQRLDRERQERQDLINMSVQGLQQQISGMNMLGQSGQQLLGSISDIAGQIAGIMNIKGKGIAKTGAGAASGSTNNTKKATTALGDVAPFLALGQAVKSTISEAGDWVAGMISNFIQSKQQLEKDTEDLAAKTLQTDLEVRKQKLENLKLTLGDTEEFRAAERKLIQDQATFAIAQSVIDTKRQEDEIRIRYHDSEEAQRLILDLWKSQATERTRINAQAIAQLEQMEQAHIQKMADAGKAANEQLSQLRLAVPAAEAGLTPGKADDLALAKAARDADALAAYDRRIAPLKEQFKQMGLDPIKDNIDKFINDSELGKLAGKELDATRKKNEHDDTIARLQEEARIRQVLAQTDEESIKFRLRGEEQELALIRSQSELKRQALDDQLKDPTLDPRERAALQAQFDQIGPALDKQIADSQQKWAFAAANAAKDLQAEIAKGTKTGLDDAVADYDKALQKITEDEATARETMTGAQLSRTLATLAQRRVNAEVETQKKLKQLWAQEYVERLNQQKTLIQESIELKQQEIQAGIRTAQDAMRPLQVELQKLQRDLDESQRKRDAEKRAYVPKDGKRNAQFSSDLAALDASPEAWSGAQVIANTATHNGLPTVSGATQREGLLKEAALQELEANNMVTDERITEAEFAARMQHVSLLKVKAAEMELATVKDDRERKLELEKEWAEGYAAWQQYATEAIDARFDTEDQRTKDNMDLKQQAIQQQQDSIDSWQLQLDKLNRAAEDKVKPIDEEIKRVERSTRDWADQWSNVTSGIAATREEMDKLLASQQKLLERSSGGGNVTSSGGGGSGQQTANVANAGANYAEGTGGTRYTTTSDLFAAEGGNASGGFTKNDARFGGDRLLTRLDKNEAIIPFHRWPEILRPWMPPARGGGGNQSSFQFNPTITGNTIIGEFDFYKTAYKAAADFHQEITRELSGNAGRLY